MLTNVRTRTLAQFKMPNIDGHLGQQLAGIAASVKTSGAASSKSADSEIVNLVRRSSFGIEQSMLLLADELGIEAFLEWQLDPAGIDDGGLEQILAGMFPTLEMGYLELFEAVRSDQDVNPAAELIIATIFRQLFSPRQLYEVMVEFWTNHFSMFLLKDAVQYLKTADDRDHVRPNALGFFKDLLRANAAGPAMLIYLDNASNTVAGPNENYARELMELHTLGVGGGYTEEDVKAVARAFTGWTLDERSEGLFVFNRFAHDFEAKTVLGVELPAGQGIEDGRAVLDLLAQHPSTAKFVATKLCRHFVADEPPESLVETVAQTFVSTDGYIPDLLRTLFLSPEFNASQGAKYKRPAEFVGSMFRSLNPVVGDNFFRQVFNQLESQGQVPFFWHHPDGYPDTQAEWLSTSSLLSRWNFGFAAAFGGPLRVQNNDQGDEQDPGPEGLDEARAGFLKLPLFQLMGGARTPSEIVDALSIRIVHQTLSDEDRQTLIDHARGGRRANTSLVLSERVVAARRVIADLLASRYFQAR